MALGKTNNSAELNPNDGSIVNYGNLGTGYKSKQISLSTHNPFPNLLFLVSSQRELSNSRGCKIKTEQWPKGIKDKCFKIFQGKMVPLKVK